MDSSNCILPPQIFHIVRVFVGKSKLANIIYSDVVVNFKQLFTYFGAKVDPTSYKLTRPPKHAVMRLTKNLANIEHIPEHVYKQIIAVGRINVVMKFYDHGIVEYEIFHGVGTTWTLPQIINLLCEARECELANSYGLPEYPPHSELTTFYGGLHVLKSRDEDEVIIIQPSWQDIFDHTHHLPLQ